MSDTSRPSERISWVLRTYLFDCDEDLYGKDCIVFFRKFQRPEHKFASFEALKAQIARDIEAGHAFFEK